MVSPVLYDQMVFGSHDSHLYCLDANNLKLLWKERDKSYYGFVTIIAGNGRVMIITIDGELLLVRAGRNKYELISRLQALTDENIEVWSHPALVEGLLYLRDKTSVRCLKLK
jgi:outer membrane protein assembly factor BamB